MTTTIMKPRKYITLSDLLEWAKQLPRETKNPVRTDPLPAYVADTVRCAYVGDDGSHCIAGEFFSDHGITDQNLSGTEGVSAARVAMNNGFSGEVADALNIMQTAADLATKSAHQWGYKVHPWGYAVDELEKHVNNKAQVEPILVSLAEWKPLDLVGSI